MTTENILIDFSGRPCLGYRNLFPGRTSPFVLIEKKAGGRDLEVRDGLPQSS
jgi:hypothetical protein